jgi:hypothetical protein
LQLLIKTTGKEPQLLEQPVYITIEEVEAKDKPKEKETLEAATAPPPPANGTH